MAFFLLMGFAGLWFVGMYFTSKSAFRASKTHQRFKRALLTFCLSVAPFAHEIYVYYGFQLYCEAYGGITKLQPVYTNTLAFDQGIVTEYGLLTIPAIKHAKYTGTERSFQSLPISLTSDPKACLMQAHQKRVSSNNERNREMAIKNQERGYCYSTEPLTEEPRYLVTLEASEKFQYRKSASVLYPRLIGSGAPIELIDTLDGTVKSSYISLLTKPGFLAKILIPHMKNYSCPALVSGRDNYAFPSQSNVYAFLDKAILKAQ